MCMQKGNANGALKLLSDKMQNGILPLNQETLNLFTIAALAKIVFKINVFFKE